MTANLKEITLTEELWLVQVRGEWRIVECWSSAVRLEDYVDSWSVYIFSSKRRLVIVLFPKTQVGNQWLCLNLIFWFCHHSIMRLHSERFFFLVPVFLLYAIWSFYLSKVGNWCQYCGFSISILVQILTSARKRLDVSVQIVNVPICGVAMPVNVQMTFCIFVSMTPALVSLLFHHGYPCILLWLKANMVFTSFLLCF